MTRIFKYTLLILGFAASTSYAQTGNLYTLQQCIETGIKNNLTVKQNALQMLTDSVYYSQAKTNMFPTLSANAGRTLNQGRAINPITNTYVNQSITYDGYGLNSGVTVFNGLALQNLVKQASLNYQAGKMDLQAAKDQVTVNIITNYLSILDAQESLSQTKSALAVAKETLDRLEILEKQGNNKNASDIYDQRGLYANNQASVASAQNSLNAARLSLFALMNIPYNPDATFQPLNAADLAGEYGITPEQVYQTALNELPVVKSAVLKRQAAEKNLKVYKGYLMPTLSLNGGIATSYSSVGATSYTDQFRNNYQGSIGASLNIPIFLDHARKNNVTLAKFNLQGTEYVEDNVKIVLKQSVEQAYYNMMSAYQRYHSWQEAVTNYTESFRISKLRFEAGVLTSVDYTISKNQMDNANLNLISARYDYYIYSKVLDYYQGKLNLQ